MITNLLHDDGIAWPYAFMILSVFLSDTWSIILFPSTHAAKSSKVTVLILVYIVGLVYYWNLSLYSFLILCLCELMFFLFKLHPHERMILLYDIQYVELFSQNN